MQALVAAHSGLRWLVLAGLVAVAVWALGRGREAVPGWVAWVRILFIVQVLLGAVLYVANSGWEQGAFIAAWHPVAMVAALGAFEAGSGRARRTDTPRTLGVFTVVSIVLVLAAIPWGRGLA